MMPEARWPNQQDSNAAHSTWADSGKPFPSVSGGLTGAVVWQSSWFSSVTGIALNNSASSLVLNQGHNMCAVAYGYKLERTWVCGVLGLLDTAREWCYVPAAHTLYFWAPLGGVPANVEYKKRNFAFDLRGKPYITIKKVMLFAATVITDHVSINCVIDSISARYVSHYVTLPAFPLPPIVDSDSMCLEDSCSHEQQRYHAVWRQQRPYEQQNSRKRR